MSYQEYSASMPEGDSKNGRNRETSSIADCGFDCMRLNHHSRSALTFPSESLRECFLIHHKGHEEHKGFPREGQTSCKSVKFVAQTCPKGSSTSPQRNFKTLSKDKGRRLLWKHLVLM